MACFGVAKIPFGLLYEHRRHIWTRKECDYDPLWGKCVQQFSNSEATAPDLQDWS